MGKTNKTKLYNHHISLGGNMVSFFGYALPIYYSSIIKEHEAVRSNAGLFDVSHMGEFIISGKDAKSFIQKITINDIDKITVGQIQYSAMCNENGGIIDDLLIYKRKDDFMMVVNASNRKKDLSWLKKNCDEDLSIKDISDDISMVAIQGPKSRIILQHITNSNLMEIGYYNFIEGKLNKKKALISRTGYTGELGYEVYAKNIDIIDIWDSIIEVGNKYGIMPAGLGCRDTLRLEMKYLLHGNDINDRINPIEAGLGWITRLNKTSFIGKNAIIAQKHKIKRRLVCIEMRDKAIPRKGFKLYLNSKQIGEVTSGTMSPSLGKGIGIGYVDIPYTKFGIELQVSIRGKMKICNVVKSPFYNNGSLLD
tara:strand:- start:3276 stop:4373 length:1098 start_codon:yes stop_codon:yes gene_type:complete